MGLDMYLNGEKSLWSDFRKEDDFKVKSMKIELGYWRKHPDLHGFIVQTFAKGVDECQIIPLDEKKMREIIEAIRNNKLPHTQGFFFGSSDWYKGKEEENIAIFEKAISWLKEKKEDQYREVYYRASW